MNKLSANLNPHRFGRTAGQQVTWATRQCGVSCSVGQFVQDSTFVLRMNFCGCKPALRVAPNRYTSFELMKKCFLILLVAILPQGCADENKSVKE